MFKVCMKNLRFAPSERKLSHNVIYQRLFDNNLISTLESKLPLNNRIRIDKDDYVSEFENVKIGETRFVFLENIA